MPWNHNDLTERTGTEAHPAVQLALTSYTTPWNNQEHVIFVDPEGQVHELFYDGTNWIPNNLSTLASELPRASPRLPARPDVIVGYGSDWDEQQHIVYIDMAGNINRLHFDGSWHHINFADVLQPSDLTRWGLPAVQGMLTAYHTPWSQQHHIFYFGESGALIHEMYISGDQLHPNNLTPPNLATSPLGGMRGYTTPWDDQQHVVVVTPGSYIYEIYNDGEWRNNVLGTDPHASRAGHNRAIHSHLTISNRQQHVIYVDNFNHIQELVHSGEAGNWTPNDLTQLATITNGGNPVGVAGSPGGGEDRSVNSYTTLWNGQQHVNYVDSLGFINELYYDDGSWRHNNLTTLAPGAENAKSISGGIAIAGHATDWNNQQHVFYIGGDGHIHELYYSD